MISRGRARVSSGVVADQDKSLIAACDHGPENVGRVSDRLAFASHADQRDAGESHPSSESHYPQSLLVRPEIIAFHDFRFERF